MSSVPPPAAAVVALEERPIFVEEAPRRQLEDALAEVIQLRSKILDQSERDLAELALEIARQVLIADVEGLREYTRRMCDRALLLLEEADKITIRVHPEHYQAVLAAHPELEGRGKVQLLPDPTIELAGVVAECELGRVDARLAGRLDEVRRQLGLESRSKASSP
ncbi:MAG: hypothetical protein HY791_25110 [Deltaproteobacteria bacterium]|nr:hypothetical protein [Deltaproteobacteria bacterium]